MKLICAGFNLYGQFVSCEKALIESFSDCSYGCELEDLQFGYSFSVGFKKSCVYVHGFKLGKTHQVSKFNFDEEFRIKQVSCNDCLVLVLGENGTIYKIDFKSEGEVVPRLLPNFLSNGGNGNDKTAFSTDKVVDDSLDILEDQLSLDNEQTIVDNKHIFLDSEQKSLLRITVDNKQISSGNKQTTLSNAPTVLSNTIVGSKESDKFIKISLGSKLTVALSNQGKIFNLPNKLDFESTKLIDIQAGHEHCLLLDSDGNVFSFGSGSRGQLGHGDLEDQTEPKQIEALAGIAMSKITSGGWHSCALSGQGDLYVWGWNGNGQLGLDGFSVMATPHVVNFEQFLDTNVIDVACGSRHTIALMDNGKLFGCGWNRYFQLGNFVSGNSEMNVSVFKHLYDFTAMKVTSLRCGKWSTVIFVE